MRCFQGGVAVAQPPRRRVSPKRTVAANLFWICGDGPVAPERTRTSTPCRAQALNLLRMPIPPPGLATILYSDAATCQTGSAGSYNCCNCLPVQVGGPILTPSTPLAPLLPRSGGEGRSDWQSDPEVWPFGESGGEIAKIRFRRGEKNKKKAFFIAAAKPPQ